MRLLRDIKACKMEKLKNILTLTLLLSLSAVAVADEPMETRGLDGVKLITSFAHNLGSLLDAVEYKGKRYTPHEAADALIPQIGWKHKERRKEIAMAWVEQVSLLNSSILRQPNEDFESEKMSFHPPKVVEFDDGSVEVKLWVQGPPGMQPISTYHREHYLFSDAGTLKNTRLETQVVPIF